MLLAAAALQARFHTCRQVGLPPGSGGLWRCPGKGLATMARTKVVNYGKLLRIAGRLQRDLNELTVFPAIMPG